MSFLGCCCTLCSGIFLNLTVGDHCGNAYPGALVTLSQGGTTIATATTNGSGAVSFPIPATGTYSYSVSVAGVVVASGTATFAACTTQHITVTLPSGPSQICVTVSGCSPWDGSGANVTVSSGGSTIGTAVTTSGGACIPVPAFGTYTVVMTGPTGYTTNTSSVTVAACKVTKSVTLSVASGYSCTDDVCCPAGGSPPFLIPVYPTTLFLNDGLGTITLTGSIGTGWTGCATRSATGPGPTCPVPPGSTVGAITVGMQATVTCTSGAWNLELQVLCYCGTYALSVAGSANIYPTSGDCAAPNPGTIDSFVDIALTPSACPPSMALSGSWGPFSCTGPKQTMEWIYTCGSTWNMAVTE